MKEISKSTTLYFSTPSEYAIESDKLFTEGWIEKDEDFSFSPNGIYATFIKYYN